MYEHVCVCVCQGRWISIWPRWNSVSEKCFYLIILKMHTNKLKKYVTFAFAHISSLAVVLLDTLSGSVLAFLKMS